MRSLLVWLLACSGMLGLVTSAPLATADTACQAADLYVSDDDSPLFELQADLAIASTGVAVTGSTPVHGVFWSDRFQQATFEDARRFRLCVADEPTLRHAAEAVRYRFDQQAVLTFLPYDGTNALSITVPDVDLARFGAAFVADVAAQRRLQGGSVTTEDHTLILVARTEDLDIARRLAESAGGDWQRASLVPGNRELVTI